MTAAENQRWEAIIRRAYPKSRVNEIGTKCTGELSPLLADLGRQANGTHPPAPPPR